MKWLIFALAVVSLAVASGAALAQTPTPASPQVPPVAPQPSPPPGQTPEPPKAYPRPTPAPTPVVSPQPAPQATVSPGTTGGQADVPPPGEPSVSRESGLVDPLCQQGSSAASRGCRTSGVVFREHDLSHYGLDAVDTQSFQTLKDNLFDGITQEIIVRVWYAVVWLLNAALVLLQWGFMLDPVNDAMSGVGRALDHMHNRVLGKPWFLASMAILGLWGIWNGLIRLKIIETFTGLIAAMALMTIGLWIISDPKDTVGWVAHQSNQTAMSVLSVATRGEVASPSEGLRDTTSGLFDQLVGEPWCALQFGDVQYCHAEQNGRTTQDLWLAYPARSAERLKLYEEATANHSFWGKVRKTLSSGPDTPWGQLPDEVKAAVRREPEKLAMMEPPGSATRFGLLMLILPGMLAACSLILWLGLKTIQAGFWALVVLTFMPWFLFAPSFGEAGRKIFLEAVVRLFSALLFVLLCAVYLASLMVVSTQIGRLTGPDLWMQKWLLLSGFWVTAFHKRNELLTLLSMGALRPDAGRLPSVLSAYAGWRLLADGTRLLTAAPRAGVRAVRRGDAMRNEARIEEREALREGERETADATLDREQEVAAHALDARAAEATGDEARHDMARTRAARATVRRAERSRARAADLTRRLGRRGVSGEQAARDQRELAWHRRFQASEEVQEARRLAGERGLGRDRAEPNAGDLERWKGERRRELEHHPDPTHDRHLIAAGISPDAYASASPARQAIMRRRSQGTMDGDRDLLEAAGRRGPHGDRDRDGVRHRLDPHEVRFNARRHLDTVRRRGQEASVRDRARRARAGERLR